MATNKNSQQILSFDKSLRDRLLASAEHLLEKQGPDGLSIREVARECGVSTMAIYTLFGGKPGVMKALYAEGFARLYQHAALAEDRKDPLNWLIGQMIAYRRFALNNVSMYRLMFGGAKRFMPVDRDSRFESLAMPDAGAYPSFGALADAVAACQNEAIEDPKMTADELTYIVWANLHGLVSLEIAGYIDERNAQEQFKNGVRFVCASLQFGSAMIEHRLTAKLTS